MSRAGGFRRVGVAVATVAASGLVLLALAPAADAGDNVLGTVGDYTYIVDSAPIATQNVAGPQVQCPGETNLAGVGGRGNVNEFRGRINLLEPTDGADLDTKPDDFVNSFFFNVADPDTAEAYAVCTTGRAKYRSATVRLRSGQDAASKVACPDGTNVTGGGARISGAIPEAWIFASHPFDGKDRKRKLDDGWRVAATNSAGTPAKDLTAYAICRPGRYRYCEATFELFPGSSSALGEPCGLGATTGPVISAGARFGAPGFEREIGGIVPFDNATDGDSIPDDQALTTVTNLGATPVHVSYYAVTARP